MHGSKASDVPPGSEFTELLRHLPTGAKVLDVGCGTGAMTRSIASRVPEACVLGIDIDLQAVVQAIWNTPAEQFPNLRFRQADLLKVSLPEAPFDLVVSRACLHYLTHPGQAFGPIARLLRSGGRMQVSCLGLGNAAAVNNALSALIQEPTWSRYFVGFDHSWGFVAPQDCDAFLHSAGFARYSCTLAPQTIDLADRGPFLAWVTSNWRGYLDRIPVSEQSRFLEEFTTSMQNRFQVDLVWLCIDAVRS